MGCTICGNRFSGTICLRCGYDESQNREQYPTLANDGKRFRSNTVQRNAFVTSLINQIDAAKRSSSSAIRPQTKRHTSRVVPITTIPTILANGSCGEHLTWQLDKSGLLSITGKGSMEDYIPGRAPWENNKVKITALKLPIELDNIGNCAFCDCVNLANVTISESVKKIGSSAFRGCTHLTSVTISRSVVNINNQAFFKCESLTRVIIPDRVTFIGAQAFCECRSLKRAVFLGRIVIIQNDAFAECPLLAIHGEKRSSAEKYALENEIPFE